MEAREQREAIKLFKAGFEPSRIDLMLGLPKGSTHDLMVRCWAAEKKSADVAKAA